MSTAPAKLALEDGTVYTGRHFGGTGETFGEVVFNTSMTGYQEVLTDPSYKGQIVTMTYPLIGNYGINGEDQESRRPQVEGFIVRELTRVPSNFRSHQTLEAYLAEHGVIGLEGIDTRALVRRLRVRGAMTGVLSTTDLDDASLVHKARTCPRHRRPRPGPHRHAGTALSLDGRLHQPAGGSGCWSVGHAAIASSPSTSA